MKHLTKLRGIKHFCHDFDGVFYSYSQIPDIQNEFAAAKASVMCNLLNNAITFKDAVAMSHEGIKKYNDPVKLQTEFASELGYDPDSFKEQLFKEYHKAIYRRFSTIAPHLFETDVNLRSAFAKCQDFLKHGVATHSCREGFCIPFLDAKGIRQFIEEHSIFGLKQSNFIPKSHTPLLVELCFQSMGQIDDSERAFTEDSTINLKIMKDSYPLVTTIYIHQGQPLDKLPNYIDFQFQDLPELLSARLEAERLTNPAYV